MDKKVSAILIIGIQYIYIISGSGGEGGGGGLGVFSPPPPPNFFGFLKGKIREN